MAWTQVCCNYDGTFGGFLTCVFESYVHREEPVEFRTPEDPACSLYPLRTIPTHEEHAMRVYRSLDKKLGPTGRDLFVRGFLTCLKEKELWLWRFVRMGYDRGPGFVRDLTDPTVDTVRRAVQHLNSEAHQYKGFVRFSELSGILVGEVTEQGYTSSGMERYAVVEPAVKLDELRQVFVITSFDVTE